MHEGVKTIEMVQGGLELEHFDLLVSLTSIRSDKVIKALRSHLVYGMRPVEAVSTSGTSFSQFSSRLTILEDVNDKVARAARFYIQ